MRIIFVFYLYALLNIPMSRYLLMLGLICLANIGLAQQSDYNAIMEEGKTALEKNRIPLAITTFSKAIAADSNNVAGYYQLGRAYMKYFDQTNEKADSALYCFNHCLLLDSTAYPDIRGRLGYIKGIMHDFTGALKEYNICINKAPDTGTYSRRALVRYKLNDTDGACSDLHEAVKMGATLPVLMLKKKMLNLHCNWMPEGSKTALYNIRFLKAFHNASVGDCAVQVAFLITPIKPEDFPPVISTKVVYTTDGGVEKKSDILHPQDNINLTTYGKNIKEKSVILCEQLKDLIDFGSKEDMMLLVFTFFNKEMKGVQNMTMTYGCWEKQDNDQRVETKYSFKVQ